MKTLLFGHKGKMGQEISRLSKENKGVSIDVFCDKSDELKSEQLSGVQVAIDFTAQAAFQKNLEICVKNEIGFVSGTTGLTEADFFALERASGKIPCLWAPNMSLGVNVMAKLLEGLSAIRDYDFQVVEAHHNKKIDSPSGTAKFLQEALNASIGKKAPEPLAIRGGGIFGIHEVWAMGDEETIKIEHTALNRSVFARGALFAALWIGQQKPGLYKMGDILSQNLTK